MRKNAKHRPKLVLALLLLVLIGITTYNLYTMYLNIEIKNSNYETQKVATSINSNENVETKSPSFHQ